MPITANGTAPYAPPSTVLDVVQRARDKGLPNPVTRDVLLRTGISDGLVNRVLQALQLLELIDAEGRHTQNLDILRKTPDNEYQARLAEIIRGVYADALAFVDPATDPPSRVLDAFRSYEPSGQRGRMVTLFMGLCRAAGIVSGSSKGTERQPAAPRERNSPRAASSGTPRGQRPKPQRSNGADGSLPEPIMSLVQSLPGQSRGWDEDARNRFVKAFEALLSVYFPVVRADAQSDEEK